MNQSKRILVVDDEPKNHLLINGFLETLGYLYEPAFNGYEALEKLENGFDLVLLDVLMPGMDGFELVRSIRKHEKFHDIPVVMVTVLDDKQTRLTAVEAGANDFINKPIDPLELRIRIESQLRVKDTFDATKRQQAELEETVRRRTSELHESNDRLKRELADRLRVEHSLRESELKFRSLFDFSPIGIVLVDTGGKILEVNRFLLETLGSPGSEDTKAINMLTFSPLVEAGISALFRECMIHRQRRSAEVPYTSKWGKKLFLRTIVTPKMDENGNLLGCQAVMEDITQRKQMELDLKESEKRFKSMSNLMRLMCDNVPDLLWAKDLEGKAIFVNKAVCDKLLGARDTEEPIGKTDYYFAERIQMENPQDPNYFTFGMSCQNSDAIVLGTMQPGRFDESGNVRGQFLVLDVYKAPFINEEGVLIGTVGCGRDVTEERQAEAERKLISEALRNSEQTLKTILSTSPVAITLIQDRRFIWTNEFGLKMFGYDSEEGHIGEDTRVVYASEAEYERVGREVYPDLASGKIAQATTRLCRQDASLFDATIRIKLVDPSSPDHLAIAVITDITDDIRAEREKQALQAQYLQAQKMEAVSALAGGIYHDFNNLLQIVLGYTDLILNDKELQEGTRANIEAIASAGDRGADLVRSLLTFSRKGKINFQPINLNDRVEELFTILTRTMPKMIDIEMILDPDLDLVNSDPTQIDQVIMNLAINARDAMHDTGKLSIETANVILDEAYCRSHIGISPGPHVLLKVSDNGHGMDKESLTHIFEPFFTTKDKGKGTGLGLATVFGIVKQHNGSIDCESDPGYGTTFKIFLPAIRETRALVSEDVTEDILSGGGKETILVVDDDDQVRDLMEEMLSGAGYTVLTASSGDEALDLYVRECGNISLIILNVLMPGMGGQKCLEEIIRINPEVKILIATGISPDDERARSVIQRGACGIIHKPIKYRKLLGKVRHILDNC